jgi:phage terminase Nu1 subunit (DNA packaging protein)
MQSPHRHWWGGGVLGPSSHLRVYAQKHLLSPSERPVALLIPSLECIAMYSGKQVNKSQLAEILGITERALTTWQEEGLPFERREAVGLENLYHTGDVIRWIEARAVMRSTGRINKHRLAQLLGVSIGVISSMQADGMPILCKGKLGESNEYDLPAVIAWMIDRAIRKAGRLC